MRLMVGELGKMIATLRQARGLSQRDLAERVGVSGPAVAQWETGGGPRRSNLPKIAAALGVTVEALLTGAVQPELDEQAELLTIFARLSADERRHLLDFARRLLR